MDIKLIRDYHNGGKWQWKYKSEIPSSSRVGGFLWFDYGPPFSNYNNAKKWMAEKE